MMVNLAFIKAPNGLFHFAMDYLAELEAETRAVLVRTPALAAVVRRRFPDMRVRSTSAWQAAAAVSAASRRGEIVFTPSPHPIPWCGRQMVVVHDSFPFEGAKGRVKAALFFLAMRTSRATAGYINKADARAFLLAGGLAPARVRSSPNRMAMPETEAIAGRLIFPARPVVGLFGTDSPKKNYERLFTAIVAREPSPRLVFRCYGQPNEYVSTIIASFPELQIELTDSGTVELESFIRSIDIVASAATREGFSRPIALALASGVPCWVVEAPVFREFYGGVATFHAGTDALSAALASIAPGTVIERPTFALPTDLERDFRQCISWLKSQDISRR